jgi:uncharacterized protein with GYD domain
MGVYVVLATLTAEGRKVVRDDPERIKKVNGEVERMGVKIVSQYALLGPYDFVNIVQADSDEVIAKAAIKVTAGGKLEVMTLPAIPIDKFIENMKRQD